MALTDREKQDYLKGRSGACPFCGSDHIEGGSFDYGGDTVAQRVTCLDCDKQWDDIYTLTDVEEVEQ